MNIQRVKITNPNNGWYGTECYINDKKISKVKTVDFHVAVDEMPVFTFETDGCPDIEMSGVVLFKFTPKTVWDAVNVLQHEFKTQPESYKAFVASIESTLKEIPEEEIWAYDAAEMIANRILGIEKQE